MGLEEIQHESHSIGKKEKMSRELESEVRTGHEMHCILNQGVWHPLKTGRKMGTFEAGEWSYQHFALEGSLATVCRRCCGDEGGAWLGNTGLEGETSEDTVISWQGHQLHNWSFPGWWMQILRLLGWEWVMRGHQMLLSKPDLSPWVPQRAGEELLTASAHLGANWGVSPVQIGTGICSLTRGGERRANSIAGW